MNILGTIASQFSGKSFTSFESIATTTVGAGGSGGIDFTSIPSTFTHLQLRYVWRSSNSAEVSIGFNSDGNTNNYYRHLIYASGGGIAAYAQQNANSFGGYQDPVANTFCGAIVDILDYTNTNKYKTVRTSWGIDTSGSGWQGLSSGLWKNTNAISSISLTVSGGSGIAQHSHFALYGIRG